MPCRLSLIVGLSFVVLRAFAASPVFETGTFGRLDGPRKLPIGYAVFERPGATRSVVLFPGYAESYVFYAEVIEDLVGAGFNVFAMDLRGMGRSGRLAANPQIVHLDRFEYYLDDAKHFLKTIVLPRTKGRPIFALTHSTGGLVAAELMARGEAPFEKAALVSPLFRMAATTTPWLDRMILGVLPRDAYVLGAGDFDPTKYPLKADTNTHSVARHDQTVATYLRYPEVVQGGPSNGWALELYSATKKFRKHRAAKIQAPVLIFQAGEDKYVDTRGQNEACGKMADCELVRLDGAYHHILMELDVFRSPAIRGAIEFFER